MGASLFELISGKNDVIINILFIISINISALGNEKMVKQAEWQVCAWVSRGLHCDKPAPRQ